MSGYQGSGAPDLLAQQIEAIVDVLDINMCMRYHQVNCARHTVHAECFMVTSAMTPGSGSGDLSRTVCKPFMRMLSAGSLVGRIRQRD